MSRSNRMFPEDLPGPCSQTSRPPAPHGCGSPRSLIGPRLRGAGLGRGKERGEELTLSPSSRKGFDPRSHGSHPALGSQISCQPGYIAGVQDGWRTRQPHSKLVVLMKSTRSGSACLCQAEGNGSLQACKGRGTKLGPFVSPDSHGLVWK